MVAALMDNLVEKPYKARIARKQYYMAGVLHRNHHYDLYGELEASALNIACELSGPHWLPLEGIASYDNLVRETDTAHVE